MLLVYVILVVLMFVCAYWLHCRTIERFTGDTPTPSEVDIMRVYEKVLQRQPTANELADALVKKLALDDLEGRLMDTDEYDRIVKVQSNSLTPELNGIIHEKKQMAYLAEIYFAEKSENVSPALLMPLRDVYIYLEYEEPAFRLFLQDAKYSVFEKKLIDTFQLSKEKTLQIFDEMFNKQDLLTRARDVASSLKQSEIRDPPILVRTFDTVGDAQASGTVGQAVVASKTTVPATAPPVVPGQTTESFANYAGLATAPEGTAVHSQVSRTIYDKDSDMRPMLYDVEQRSKNIFDIHKVAQKLDDTPDAFVYVPVVPVRYEKPSTHFKAKPPGNHDPYVSDLFGCFHGAPVLTI